MGSGDRRAPSEGARDRTPVISVDYTLPLRGERGEVSVPSRQGVPLDFGGRDLECGGLRRFGIFCFCLAKGRNQSKAAETAALQIWPPPLRLPKSGGAPSRQASPRRPRMELTCRVAPVESVAHHDSRRLSVLQQKVARLCLHHKIPTRPPAPRSC